MCRIDRFGLKKMKEQDETAADKIVTSTSNNV